MKKSITGALLCAACALWLCACSDKPRPVAEPQPEPEPMPVVVAEPDPGQPAGEPSAAELPVAEDFAEEAEASIDENNYSAALDELERELAERN